MGRRFDHDEHYTNFGINLGIDQEKLDRYDEQTKRAQERAAAGGEVPLKDRAPVGCLAVPERSGQRNRP